MEEIKHFQVSQDKAKRVAPSHSHQTSQWCYNSLLQVRQLISNFHPQLTFNYPAQRTHSAKRDLHQNNQDHPGVYDTDKVCDTLRFKPLSWVQGVGAWSFASHITSECSDCWMGYGSSPFPTKMVALSRPNRDMCYSGNPLYFLRTC